MENYLKTKEEIFPHSVPFSIREKRKLFAHLGSLVWSVCLLVPPDVFVLIDQFVSLDKNTKEFEFFLHKTRGKRKQRNLFLFGYVQRIFGVRN